MLMSLDTEAVKPQDVLGCRQEVQEATTAIGNCLKALTERQLARFLPVSVSVLSSGTNTPHEIS